MDVDILLTMVTLRAGPLKGEAPGGKVKLENFAFGAKIPFLNGNASSKAQWSDITFLKVADVSSPVLMSIFDAHDPIKTATFSIHKSGGSQEPFYTIKIKDGLISSFQNLGYAAETAAAGNVGFPTKIHALREIFTINFAKIEVDYFPQRNDGVMHGSTTFSTDIRDRY